MDRREVAGLCGGLNLGNVVAIGVAVAAHASEHTLSIVTFTAASISLLSVIILALHNKRTS